MHRLTVAVGTMSLHTKQNRAVKPKEVAAIKKELARLEAMEKSLKLREQAVVARERAVGMAPVRIAQSWLCLTLRA